MTTYKKCLVKWRDIIACNEWEKHTEINCPTLFTIGWLVFEDDTTIKIANTLDFEGWEDKDADKPVPYGITAFPKGCVIDVKFI